MDKIHSFTGLVAWQKWHKFVTHIYKITKKFPKDELFGLISQIRRAAVSITSNVAEGFSRKSPKEKAQFYYMALGSLTEIQNQLLISKDLGYINQKEFQEFANNTVELSKLIHGLIKSASSLT